MNGAQFIRKARKLAKKLDVSFEVRNHTGGSGHKTVYFGNKLTTVKSGDIGKGLLHRMCAQLGIVKEDL